MSNFYLIIDKLKLLKWIYNKILQMSIPGRMWANEGTTYMEGIK